MKALLLTDYENFEVKSTDPPTITSKQILVRAVAIAINPADWKLAEWRTMIKQFPAILGWDVAGIVEQVGDDVKRFKKGDHVFGDAHLLRRGSGAFAELVAVDAALAYKKPEFLPWEQAATFPLGIGTAAQGLYSDLNIPPPSKKITSPEFILIWGGSSSVGAFAIQLAVLSGLTVITTCSPANAEYVKQLGASYVIDRAASDAVEQIRKIAPHLKYAFDCISSESANKCLKALDGTEGAGLATAGGPGEPTDPVPSNVTHKRTTVGKLDDSIVGEILEPLILSKQVVPNPVEVLPNGLEGITKGISLLKEKKVSGKKLVVKLSD